MDDKLQQRRQAHNTWVNPICKEVKEMSIEDRRNWLTCAREQAFAMMEEHKKKLAVAENIYDILGMEIAELG